MSKSRAKLIVNPAAGGGTAARDWPLIHELLQQGGLDFDYELTRYRGQAVEIAREAVDIGCKHLIAVGGDGTVNEVINGIFLSPNNAGTTLGIVFRGTAQAFSYSIGITRLTNGLPFLVNPKRYLIDIGLAQCQKNGQTITRYFFNEASIGLTSDIVNAWGMLPEKIGMRTGLFLRRVLGYGAFFRYRNRVMKICVGDNISLAKRSAVIIANGRYFADGMQIAPQAAIDDGFFDVITINDVSKFKLLKMQPALYRGDHLTYPEVRLQRSRSVTVDSTSPLPVEVDGEIIGETPVTFTLLPGALTIII